MSLNSPLISIAITTFDRKELLIETLNSIINQNINDFEILVGNDNIDRFIDSGFTGINNNRIKYINNKQNLGEWENLRNLYRISIGKYFVSISDDDLFAPDFFNQTVEAIKKNHFPDCVYTSWTSSFGLFNLDHNINESKKIEDQGTLLKLYLRGDIKILGNSGVIKKDFLGKYGGIQKWNSLAYADTYLALLVLIKSKSPVYLVDPLIYFRNHNQSLSSELISLDDWITSQIEFINNSKNLIKSANMGNYSFFLIIKNYCINSFFHRMYKLKHSNIFLVKSYISLIFSFFSGPSLFVRTLLLIYFIIQTVKLYVKIIIKLIKSI
jgi:glycosyltransferase involved in cell wall biosynthesis